MRFKFDLMKNSSPVLTKAVLKLTRGSAIMQSVHENGSENQFLNMTRFGGSSTTIDMYI